MVNTKINATTGFVRSMKYFLNAEFELSKYILLVLYIVLVLHLLSILLDCRVESKRVSGNYISEISRRKKKILVLISLLLLVYYISIDFLLATEPQLPSISETLPENIEVISDDNISEYHQKYYIMKNHYKFNNIKINEPVLYDNKLYICTENDQLIVYGYESNEIEKYLEFNALGGSLYTRNRPLVYDGRYYIFIKGGLFIGNDRLNILDLKTGELVHQKKHGNIDGHIFEIYKNYLIYGEYGINIESINFNDLRSDKIFYYDKPSSIGSDRVLRVLGKKTIIFNNNLYLFLEEYGNYVINLVDNSSLATSKNEQDYYQEYLSLDTHGESVITSTSEKRFLNIISSDLSINEVFAEDLFDIEYSNSNSTLLKMYDKNTSNLRWDKEIESKRIKYAITDNTIFVITKEGLFYTFDRNSGNLLQGSSVQEEKDLYTTREAFNLNNYDIYGIGNKLVIVTTKGNLMVLEERIEQ